MTTNQRRAIETAKGLLSGAVTTARLSEADWHLLLLGAGMNCQQAPLHKVAGQVLENADRHAGYFARVTGGPTASPEILPSGCPADFHFLMPADAPTASALDVQDLGEHFHAQR
jgi:hypothetical protein